MKVRLGVHLLIGLSDLVGSVSVEIHRIPRIVLELLILRFPGSNILSHGSIGMDRDKDVESPEISMRPTRMSIYSVDSTSEETINPCSLRTPVSIRLANLGL